jgi:hypothetical protein
MSKKQIDEGLVSRFVGSFLDSIHKGTQKRFMDKASNRLKNKEVQKRMSKIDKEIKDLENFIKTL